MKYRLIISLLLFVILLFNCYVDEPELMASPTPETTLAPTPEPTHIVITPWAKTYGGTDSDYAPSVIETSDGNLLVAGITRSYGAGLHDSLILKLDSAGTIDWQKTYGTTGYDNPFSIKETADNGFIVAGSSGSASNVDMWLLKRNSNGSIAWQKRYGGYNHDEVFDLETTSDNGFIIAGYTISFGAGEEDMLIIKLTENGEIEWQKAFGGMFRDVAYSVRETADNSFIVAGHTYSFGAGDYDAVVMELTSDGDIQWIKTFGSTGNDQAYGVYETFDNGFIITGLYDLLDAGDKDVWLIKLDSDGTLLWQKTYGGAAYEEGKKVQETEDHGFIVAGHTKSFGAGEADCWIVKFTNLGEIEWQKAYGGTGYEEARLIQETTDHGFIVSVQTNSFGAGNYDFWILKLDNNGNCPPLGMDTDAVVTIPSPSITDLESVIIVTTTTVTGVDTICEVNENPGVIVGQQAP